MSEMGETSETPGEADVEAAQADAEAPSRQFDTVNAVRVIVGGLGLAGFVLGAIVAVRSESATTLLIVSAILLLLAALGLDWEEIRGTYGGATLQFLRRGLGNVEQQIERVAANEDVPAGVREELESLREQVKALTPPERPRRRVPSPATAELDSLFRELFRTKATHTFKGTSTVELSLQIAADANARYRCTVTTPSGASFSQVARRRGGVPWVTGIGTFLVVYPDEVPDSEPLVPGRYVVEWRSAPLIDPVGRSAASQLGLALMQGRTPPVATDSFTIPELRASTAPENAEPS